jgi:hypothetical protein
MQFFQWWLWSWNTSSRKWTVALLAERDGRSISGQAETPQGLEVLQTARGKLFMTLTAVEGKKHFLEDCITRTLGKKLVFQQKKCSSLPFKCSDSETGN